MNVELTNQDESAVRGGIDFNADKMDVQLRSVGQAIQFKVDPAMLKQLQNTPGFTPVIINIQAMTNIRLFLGIKE